MDLPAVEKVQKISYETLWKAIIRPPRDTYDEDDLIEEVFIFKNRTYLRKDYQVMSSQGHVLKCSFIEPDEDSRPSELMPAVIYLHGNSSCRLEGLRMLNLLLKLDINLFVYDSAGCGLSEGEYISLGYYETIDLGLIVDFVEKIPGVGNIGLWGRSMGAATVMMYSHTDERICASVMDSPFADFRRLAKEMCLNFIKLPNLILDGAVSVVRGTIKGKNGMDIDKLRPIDSAKETETPGLFIHAFKDELINRQHSIDLTAEYKGYHKLLGCNGGHNSRRPKEILEEVAKFYTKYLINGGKDDKEDGKGNKGDIKGNSNSCKESFNKIDGVRIVKNELFEEEDEEDDEDEGNNRDSDNKKKGEKGDKGNGEYGFDAL